MTQARHRLLSIPLLATLLLVSSPPARPLRAAEPSPGAQRAVADRIRAEGGSSRRAWDLLVELCDDIGHRLSGSPQLDEAIRWAVKTLKRDGQERVRTEAVTVPRWVRGEESLVMERPRLQRLPMLGLGGSVGTGGSALAAPVMVVADEAELLARKDEVRGKIVLFNAPMPAFDPVGGSGYGRTVRYRVHGAPMAAPHGAVAVLVRSVTARSLRTPHTGAMSYGDAERKIPAAAITVEDAELIARLLRRGREVRLRLEMGARTLPDVASANVVAELRGRELPEEVVVMGGHLDSWDVGQGAHDDGSGCVMAMEALGLLRRLGLRPRRTLRVVLWTNEENGLAGAKAYAGTHAGELSRHVLAMEADSGGFRPERLVVDARDPAVALRVRSRLRKLLPLLRPLGIRAVDVGHSGADISPMKSAGVPLVGFRTEGKRYFDVHHTAADTVDKVAPGDLAAGATAMAILAYLVADLPEAIGAAP